MKEMTDLKSCGDVPEDEGADDVVFENLKLVRHEAPNDPSSATRPTRRVDWNSSAMAGFAAAHG